MRCAMTRVLPEPAPARISSGPSPEVTASRCCSLSWERNSIIKVAINILSISSQRDKLCPHAGYCCDYFFLKNCTSCSCFCAAARVLKVPRFLLLPVFGFFLREYKRYCPDFSFLIMSLPPLMKPRIEILLTFRGPSQYSKQSA